MNCTNCQVPIQNGMKFCANCGTAINNLYLSNNIFNNSNVSAQNTVYGNISQTTFTHISNSYPNINQHVGEILFYQYAISDSCNNFSANIALITAKISSITERAIAYDLKNKSKSDRLLAIKSLASDLNQYFHLFDTYVIDTHTQFNKYIKDFDKSSGILIMTYGNEIKYYWQESIAWYEDSKDAIKKLNECCQMIISVLNVFDTLIQSEKTAPYFTATIPTIKHNLSLLHDSFGQIQYILTRNNQMLKGYLTDI